MEPEYSFTETEWDTLYLAPLISAAVVGGVLLLLSVWFGVTREKSLLQNRAFRWAFVWGWIFVGFSIMWGILLRLDTCGKERGEFRVDNILNVEGNHMVIEMHRLPFKENAKSATRSIPTDADKDEGPSGTVKFYSDNSPQNCTQGCDISMKKIETKGRSMDPRLIDSYAFDVDGDDIGKDYFNMPNAPKKCEKFVLRSGVNDFSHYGDVMAAFMNQHAIANFSDQLPAAITPVLVHLYFKDVDTSELEYEGVYLLVPKWHDYECAYDDPEKDYWKPGKGDFKNLMLEQTTRPDRQQVSFYGTNYYTIRSRSEDFNRASLVAVNEQEGEKIVNVTDSCYKFPYANIDNDHLALTIAFNQLVPSWDMYMSSEYSVVDSDSSKCYLGPIWDREIEAHTNAKLAPDGFVEPHAWWYVSKSKAWHIVDHHMKSNTNNLLNLVKNKIYLVETAHNNTMNWIQTHTSVLRLGATRWHLPGRVCFYGFHLYPNLHWGDTAEDKSRIPGIFTKLFNERKAWLENSDSFDNRRAGIYITAERTFLTPDGGLPWIITSSLLLGIALLLEVAEYTALQKEEYVRVYG